MAGLKFDPDGDRRARARNRRERYEFIDLYVAWMRRTPNRIWSGQQGQMLDSFLRSLPRRRARRSRKGVSSARKRR